MSIIRRNFVPSKTNYAFDWSTLEFDTAYGSTFYIRVDAIWATKSKGTMYLSTGNVGGNFRDLSLNEAKSAPVDFFLEHFDGRYGASPDFKWDGDYMFAPSKTLKDMIAASLILDPSLKNLPNVPSGFDGWYDLNG